MRIVLGFCVGLGVALSGFGCGGDNGDMDAGPADTGMGEADVGVDAFVGEDSGALDSGEDTGAVDSGGEDSGALDSGVDSGNEEIDGGPQCTDSDGNGYGEGVDCLGTDCNEGDTAIHAGATELCDGIDNNCDGTTDEGFDLTADAMNCGACGAMCEGLNANCMDSGCCISEIFDGSELGDHWNPTHIGSATYSVSGDRITITDSAFAPASSDPTRSWIYDPDFDRANQMAWTVPIGTGDFDIRFEVSWDSSVAQLTFGGVGLTNSRGLLELYAGYGDGSNSAPGSVRAIVRQPGAGIDGWANGALSGTGSADMRLTRTAGVVNVEVDGEMVLASMSEADIAHLVIFSVRHFDASTEYEFGTISIGRIDVCGARTECPASTECCSDDDCASGVCEAGVCRAGLGCVDGPRHGFTHEVGWPDVAVCGPAGDYATAIAMANNACDPTWHVCSAAEIDALNGAPPHFDSDAIAWVDYVDSATSLHFGHSDASCSAMATAANLQGTDGCTSSGAFPEGWRLGVAERTWSGSHATSDGCIAHVNHFCGYSGGAVMAEQGYVACCRD